MRLIVTEQLDHAVAERSLRRDVRAWIERALKLAPQVFQKLQREPKSGHDGPIARRSAPGEVPAQQTGRLGREIETVQPDDLHGEARWQAGYASYLETGTAHLAARPFLERTAEGVLSEARSSGLLRGVSA